MLTYIVQSATGVETLGMGRSSKGGVIMAQQVRLIVNLFDKFNFLGQFRTLVADLADFGFLDFIGRAASVSVVPGPNFISGDAIRLWSQKNFTGQNITLRPGFYNDLRNFNFLDRAASMRIIRL